MSKSAVTTKRVVIESVTPRVNGGRFPAKSPLGDPVVVTAKIFADGHDSVAAVLAFRRAATRGWKEVPMSFLGNDGWESSFTPDELGIWQFGITAWVDHFLSWRSGLEKKAEAGVDVGVDLLIGADLVAAAADRARGRDAKSLASLSDDLSDASLTQGDRVLVGLSEELSDLMTKYPDRSSATTSETNWEVTVDRERAVFSTWYELFPRSWSNRPGEHGTFADVEEHLDYVAGMGFDVLYLPPIHPIGHDFRKGPNNSLDPGPQDPGVPWAIGSEDGGHTSIHPDLGTLDDFRSLVASASEVGLEIALDIAFQCSPDHPWVSEHPEWFKSRPDGTIQYAENPPKKYQDIYPLDFETSDPEGLWAALKAVFDYWIEQGVRIFRVDNPHTKAFPFWEWAIAELGSEHPDVILLSEAFTRPAVMHRLAKVGFNQSYTYFAWRNTKHELTQYMADLEEVEDFFRPNFWPNTPDILTEQLQTGGRAAFIVRYVLAATLSSNCGIYGPAFELMEHEPLRPGSEEYLNSEKYQIRVWDLDRDDSLAPVITQMNKARHAHQALQRNRNLVFHGADNDMIVCYSKAQGSDVILTVVNLDPHHVQSAWVHLDTDAIGVQHEGQFQVHDLLTDRRYLWSGPDNFVHLDPAGVPAHVFSVERQTRTEQNFDSF
jgi:starch synthase (maltosyl-transferring)